jgi:hypothetical protein
MYRLILLILMMTLAACDESGGGKSSNNSNNGNTQGNPTQTPTPGKPKVVIECVQAKELVEQMNATALKVSDENVAVNTYDKKLGFHLGVSVGEFLESNKAIKLPQSVLLESIFPAYQRVFTDSYTIRQDIANNEHNAKEDYTRYSMQNMKKAFEEITKKPFKCMEK